MDRFDWSSLQNTLNRVLIKSFKIFIVVKKICDYKKNTIYQLLHKIKNLSKKKFSFQSNFLLQNQINLQTSHKYWAACTTNFKNLAHQLDHHPCDRPSCLWWVQQPTSYQPKQPSPSERPYATPSSPPNWVVCPGRPACAPPPFLRSSWLAATWQHQYWIDSWVEWCAKSA